MIKINPIVLEENEIKQIEIKELEQEQEDNYIKDLEIEVKTQKENLNYLHNKLNTILKICFRWDSDLYDLLIKRTNVQEHINITNKQRDYKEYLEVE